MVYINAILIKKKKQKANVVMSAFVLTEIIGRCILETVRSRRTKRARANADIVSILEERSANNRSVELTNNSYIKPLLHVIRKLFPPMWTPEFQRSNDTFGLYVNPWREI